MIQSVHRVANILSLFKDQDYLTVTEISKRMQLPKTTVYGLVNTLKAEGLLEQDAETKAYFLGIGIFELASRFRGRSNLRSIAIPLLQDLANRSKETVQLTILDGRDTVYLYKIATPNFMTFAISEGVRFPGHCTSSGKAILAHMPTQQVSKLFDAIVFEQPTPYSTASYEQLSTRLEETRRKGYSVDLQECHIGLCGVGVPIFDHHGEVCGSICFSFLYENFDAMVQSKISLLKDCAVEISIRLGCPMVQIPPEILT